MDPQRVTRDQLTARLIDLQDSIPGVKTARRARGTATALLAVLLLAAVLLLGRRASRQGGRQ